MTSPIDNDRVRLALEDMLRTGQLGAPALSAVELRQRYEQRRIPRVDIKALVAVAAALALIVVFFTVQPLRHDARSNNPAAPPSVPSGWIAHSAYGLQIAAPRAWSVQVFGQCPKSNAGTLFIGTSQFVAFCPEYGSNTTQVDIFKTNSSIKDSARIAGSPRQVHMHGLSVLSSRNGTELVWNIPSRQVTLTGSGPKALSVMQTLSLATRSASPAVGKVNGTEYLEALVRAQVTGPIAVRSPSGSTFHVESIDGQFYFTGRPGRYLLTGNAGNVLCPSVSVTVISGEVITAPPIQCQGD